MNKRITILLMIFTTIIITACQKDNSKTTSVDNKTTVSTQENNTSKTMVPTEETLAKISANYKLKETHKNFSCVDCHGEETPLEEYYLIPSQSCFNCHGSPEDVAALTPQYDGKGGINPHNSFHLDTRIECYMCHQEHKPSRNYCAQCHDANVWMPKVP